MPQPPAADRPPRPTLLSLGAGARLAASAALVAALWLIVAWAAE